MLQAGSMNACVRACCARGSTQAARVQITYTAHWPPPVPHRVLVSACLPQRCKSPNTQPHAAACVPAAAATPVAAPVVVWRQTKITWPRTPCVAGPAYTNNITAPLPNRTACRLFSRPTMLGRRTQISGMDECTAPGGGTTGQQPDEGAAVPH